MGLAIFLLALVLVLVYMGNVYKQSVFMVDGSGRQHYLGYELKYSLLDHEFVVWRRIKGKRYV
jgi:hypothetical protein